MISYVEARESLVGRVEWFGTLAEHMDYLHKEFPDHEQFNSAAREYLAGEVDNFREFIVGLTWNQLWQHVISAEPGFARVGREAERYFKNLVEKELIALPEEDEGGCPKLVKTRMPPRVPTEITGETLMEYIRELHAWIQAAGEEAREDLWGGENLVVMPELGQRYGLGDFTQTKFVLTVLTEAEPLRGDWEKLAFSEAYWPSVLVGAQRVKLIRQAAHVLEQLLNPVTEDNGSLSQLMERVVTRLFE